MSAAHYLVALVLLGATVVPIALAARSLRRRHLPELDRPAAVLAEAVLVLGALTILAELLGTVGGLRRGLLAAGSPAVALGAWVAVGRRGVPARAAAAGDGGPQAARESRRPGRRAAAAAAIGGTAALAVAWVARSVEVLGRGMADPDTLWYHMPFAARFAQDGWTTRLHFAESQPITTFHPAASELLHAVGISLMGGYDLLSPFVNLGFGALALLAGWCAGRPHGAGPGALLGAAAVLAVPIVTETQPGEAANDVAGLALLLAAVALVASGPTSPATAAVAGLAAGLAAGTKLSLLAPVAALTAGAIAVAPAGRRRAAALAWLAALTAGGAFWYLRNLAAVGNPLPWIGIELGPLRLPSPPMPLTEAASFPVARYLTDVDVLRGSFVPQLGAAMGPAWPLLLALAAAGLALALLRPADRTQRMLGAVGVASGAAYLVTPGGAAGPEGFPILFGLNLRFATPALALGLLALAVSPVMRPGRRAAVLCAALLAAVLVSQLAADPPPPAGAVAAGAGLSALAGAAALGLHRAARSHGRRVAAAGLAALVAAVAAGGWLEQRSYLRARYAEPGPTLPAPSVWARGVRDSRIAIVGYLLQYPLYGTDLSNRVDYLGRRGPHGAFARFGDCRGWRRALAAGRYRYVVTSPVGSVALGPRTEDGAGPPPEEAWTRSSPAARQVMGDRASQTAVFRLDGAVGLGGCPPPATTLGRTR